MGWGEPHTPRQDRCDDCPEGTVPIALARDPYAALILALRQCMTHPAGPLSTITLLVDLVDTDRTFDVAARSDLRLRVEAWLDSQEMDETRRHKARQFLRALFDGALEA